MPSPNDICFGNCTIHVSQREVLLNAQLQSLSQAAFDLLIHLIDKRDQVVYKQALCKLVWGERRISEKLLAKTVMQIRQAIGDRVAEPQWIRTVHGFGYRFVGDITHVTAESASAASAMKQRVRLAILPIENRTGETSFVWIELGLATLVAQALGSLSEIAPVPTVAVLKVLSSVPDAASIVERVSILRSALNAGWVVHAFLQRENGLLKIFYRGFCNGECRIDNVVSGHDVVQLGEELAKRLSHVLVPSQIGSVRFESADPFVSQLIGRATQFLEKREWRSAMQFSRTALIVEPASTPARLLLLRALVNCADPEALALGDTLLKEARSAADQRLEGIVHEALAGLILRRDFTAARHHLEQALRLSEFYSTEEWAIRTRLYAAADAGWRGDFGQSRLHYKWLHDAQQEAGDQLGLALTIANQATLSLDMHELNSARQLFDNALKLAQRYGWVSLEAHALGKLAAVQALRGCTSTAINLLARAEELSSSLQDDMVIGSLLENSIVVYGGTRSTSNIDRLLHRWSYLESSSQPLVRAFHRMCSGQRAACSGDFQLASRLMREAVDLVVELNYPAYMHRWMARLMTVYLRAGDASRTAALRDEMQSSPAGAANRELQMCLAHAGAWSLHRQGQSQAALEHLVVAVPGSPEGLVSAHARLDAAWLAMELGHRTQAGSLVQDIAPWLDEDPVGLAVAARLQFEAGNAVQAVLLHGRAAAAFADQPAQWFERLRQTYEAAARGEGRMRLPPLPTLISVCE